MLENAWRNAQYPSSSGESREESVVGLGRTALVGMLLEEVANEVKGGQIISQKARTVEKFLSRKGLIYISSKGLRNVGLKRLIECI